MKFVAKNGEFETNDLYTKVCMNTINIEKKSKENPLEVDKYPIGYVVPLGTLGNAPNAQTQFSSNFHLIAYTIAKDLIDVSIDFEDFNIKSSDKAQGHILKLSKRLDDLAERTLGTGWHITVFNVNLQTTIDSMCKGANDVDTMSKTMDEFYSIMESRLKVLANSSQNNPIKHEVVELFYAPLRAISKSITKIVESRSKSTVTPLGVCNDIIIETLVYDDYANGLRLLANTESFASSKIRQYRATEGGGEVYLLVLKARLAGEDINFRPIRQFAGKSRISVGKTSSGCSERIIYNLVNKNYKHWSFIALPMGLTIELKNLD